MKNNDWRIKIGKKWQANDFDWRFQLHTEFVEFAREVEKLSELYYFNFWGGGVDNYAITLSQVNFDGKSISVKMIASDKYYYYVSFKKAYNPNRLENSDYDTFIGATMDEALKYIHTFLMDNKYEPDLGSRRYCFMGGAYDRYPLAKRWAMEEMMNR